MAVPIAHAGAASRAARRRKGSSSGTGAPAPARADRGRPRPGLRRQRPRGARPVVARRRARGADGHSERADQRGEADRARGHPSDPRPAPARRPAAAPGATRGTRPPHGLAPPQRPRSADAAARPRDAHHRGLRSDGQPVPAGRDGAPAGQRPGDAHGHGRPGVARRRGRRLGPHRPSRPALRDLVLRAPLRLPRPRVELQPPALQRPGVRRRSRRPRLLVRALGRDARRPGRGSGSERLSCPRRAIVSASNASRRRVPASCRSPLPDAAWTAWRPAPASSSSGASSPPDTGTRPTRSPSRPRRTAAGCASRSRLSAITARGSRHWPREPASSPKVPTGRSPTSVARARARRTSRVASASPRSGPCSRQRRSPPAAPRCSTAPPAPQDLVHRDELEDLAHRRGIDVQYLLGDHRDPSARHLLDAVHLRRLIPDLVRRDVFLCGPPAMARATVRELHAAGVARRRIHTERFAF